MNIQCFINGTRYTINLKKDTQECPKSEIENYKSQKDLQEIYLSPKIQRDLQKIYLSPKLINRRVNRETDED